MQETSKFILGIVLQIVSIFIVIATQQLGWLKLLDARAARDMCCLSDSSVTPDILRQNNSPVPEDNQNDNELKMTEEETGEEPIVDRKKSLVGWWKFDETSGTVAKNSSDNNFNGQLISAYNLPSWQEGEKCLKGGCIQFNGQGQYISLMLPNIPEYTFTGWVKKYSESDDEKQIFNTSEDRLGITLYNNSSFLLFNYGYITTKTPIETNTFYHIAVTNDGQTKIIYLNGVEENRGSARTGIEQGPAAFGSSAYGESRYFSGIFDEFKLYQVVLSPEEIKDSYNTEVGSLNK